MMLGKDYVTKHIAADTKVCQGAGNIASILFTPSAGGAATAVIYDGTDTTGKKLFSLSKITSDSFGIAFTIPIYFSEGIYVDVGSNVTGLTLQYKMEHKE